jgi:hypothetical protein
MTKLIVAVRNFEEAPKWDEQDLEALESQPHRPVQDKIYIKTPTVYSSDTSVPLYLTAPCHD